MNNQYQGNAAPPFTIYLGSDVYASRGTTRLNTSAPDRLVDFAGAGWRFEADDAPILPPFMLREIVLNGSVVILNPGLPIARFWRNTYSENETEFYEYPQVSVHPVVMTTPGGDMLRAYAAKTRKWRLADGAWTFVTCSYLQSPVTAFAAPEVSVKETEPTETEVQQFIDAGYQYPIPAAAILVYPNGRGALYMAQEPFWRLEENAESMRELTTGINLLPVFSGNVGSANKLQQAFMNAIRAIIIPGRVVRDQMTSTNLITQLREEYDLRKQEYFDAMRVVDSDNPNRPVASHTSQMMAPMIKHATEIQSTAQKIYAKWGYSVIFPPVIVDTADERLKEKELLDSIRLVLGEDEYQRRIKML